MKNELSKLQNDFPALNSVIVILQKKIEGFEETYNHFKDVKCIIKGLRGHTFHEELRKYIKIKLINITLIQLI